MHRVIAPLAALVLGTLSLATLTPTRGHAAPPDGLILSRTTIAENGPPMTLIGTFTALDPDPDDTHRFVLIENPLDLFEIQDDKLIALDSLDFEAGSQRQIRVRVYDDTNAWLERSFTIQILDRNDPPLGATLSTTGTPETTPIFGLVGAFSQRGDPDQNELHTFRLLDDAEGRFVLEGNQLRTSSLLDHETHPLHALVVEVTDRAGLSATSTVLINVWDRNEPPLGATLTPSLVAENAPLGTTIGSLSAFGDPDRGELHTFLLVGDAGFALDGPLLKVAGPLDFETNPVRTVRVRVTDRGGLFTEVPVTVFLQDTNDAPTSLTLIGAGLPENAAPMTPAGLLLAGDADLGDAHHFELVDPDDEDRFLIEDDTLFALVPFDHESTPTVTVRVRATDLDGLSTVATVTVPVADLPEAPTAITLTSDTIAETASNNTIVGFLAVLDPDEGDTHELFLLQDGLGAFRIDNNRILRKSGPLDFESDPTVTLTAIAFDRAELFVVQTLTIHILDIDEPATGLAVDPPSIAENQPSGSTVGTLIPIGDPDQDKGYTFTLIENPGNRFAIIGDQLIANRVFDYEGTRTYPIRVRATPEVGLPLEQNLTIEVRDEPEPPTGLAISGNLVQENRNPGTFVATLSAQGDPDAGELHTFSLVENPGDAFAISGNTLSTAKLLDFEARATYPITLRATDRSGLFVDVPLEVRVIDLNEPPTGVDLAPRSVAENSPPNGLVGRLAPVGDPDAVDRHVYTFSSNPGDLFDIVGDALVARTPFDFETPPTSFRLVLKVADQGNLTAESVIFVTVADLNEPPSPIALSNRAIPENAPAGTVVDLITGGVDPDLEDISIFEILDGEGFAIDSERRLVTTRPFDHESEPSVELTVRLTDGGGHEVSATWSITITDVPEPATAVALSGLTVPESAPVGTVLGTLTALGDPDLGDTHTFQITADPDGVFAVSTTDATGPALVTRRAVDFEKQASHQVSITATDRAGLTVTTSFEIEVLDDNDRPTTRAELALAPIDEDTTDEVGFEVATLLTALAASDADGDPVTLLVAATTAYEVVSGTWELRRAPEPDSEPTASPWEPLIDDLELRPTDSVRFVPAPDAHGLATLTVRA
ncbi:MAG TPA: cadherin repeat domain-containing protein, partial [Myxococcota bacterium]|nr:cadherin repeat domain-containing protein [Myxococcota bacterium]